MANNDAGLILNIEGFGDFTAAIKQLDKIIDGLDSRFRSIAAGINQFGKGLDPKPLRAFAEAIDADLLNNLRELKKIVEDFKPSNNLAKLSSTMISFANSLLLMGTVAKDIPDNLDRATVSIGKFLDVVQKRGQALDTFARRIANFDATKSSVERIQQTFSDFNLGGAGTVNVFSRVRQSIVALGTAVTPIRDLGNALRSFADVTVFTLFRGGVGNKLIQIGNVLLKVKDNFAAFTNAFGEKGRLALRNLYDFIRGLELLQNIDVGGSAQQGFFFGLFGGRGATGITAQFEQLGRVFDKVSASFGLFARTLAGGAAGLRAFQPLTVGLKNLSELNIGGGFFGFIRGGVSAQLRNLSTAFERAAPGLKAFGEAIKAISPNFGTFVQFLRALGQNGNALRGFTGGGGGFTDFLNNLRNLVPNIRKVFTNLVNTAEQQGLRFRAAFLGAVSNPRGTFNAFLNNLSQLAPGLQKIFNMYVSFGRRIENAILGVFRGGKAFLDLGDAIVDGFARGVQQQGFIKTATQLGRAFINAFARVLGIRSPSTVFEAFGRDVVSGFTKGLGTFVNFAKNIATGFVNVFRNALGALPGAVAGILNAVGNQFKNFGSNIRSAGQNLISTGVQTLVGGGIAGFLQGQANTQVANFDQVINQIRIFGSLATDELGSVRQAILDFSRDTIFDPQQSGEAFLGLQKAGLSVQQSLAALPEIGNLAAAGQLNLAEATQAVVQASQIYDISIEEATRITNGYVQAANNSTASVADLQQGLSNAGPIAQQFGLGFEETLAILALFRDRGIQGAEAGTQLKSMLVGLTQPTARTTAAFRDLGVSLTDSQGRIRPVNDLINDLNKAMNETQTVTVRTSNLTAEQAERLELAQRAYAQASRQLALYNDGLTTGAVNNENAGNSIAKYQGVLENAQRVIEEITGSQEEADTITKEITRSQIENFRAIQALAGSFGGTGLSILLESGEDSITSFVDEMETLPTAAEIAAEMMATFAGRLESFKGSIQTLVINALSPLQQKVLTPLFDTLIEIVNAIAALPEPILAGAAAVGLLGTAFVTLGGAASVLSGILLTGLGTAMSTIGGLFTVVTTILFNPLGLIAGFAAVTTTVLTLIPVLTVLGVTAVAAFNIIKTAISDIQNNVGGAGDSFNELRTSVGGLFETIGGLLGEIFSLFRGIKGEVSATAEVARGSGLASFFDSIRLKIEAIRQALEGVRRFIGVFNAITGSPIAGGDQRINTLLERRAKLLDQIAAKQAAITESSTEGQKINIEAGDTLSELAIKYGTTVDELKRLNNLDSDLIIAGQELVITAAVDVDDEELRALTKEVEALDYQITQVPVEEPLDRVRRAVDTFADTDLFRRLFGDPTESGKAQAALVITNILEDLTAIKSEIPNVVDSFRLMFSGDITGGLETLRGSIGRVRTAFGEIFSSLSGGDVAAQLQAEGQVFAPSVGLGEQLRQSISGAITSITGADFAAEFTTLRDSITGNFTGLDFSSLQTTFEDHFTEIAGLITSAAGIIFGGPVGAAIGIGKIIASAIQNDFLGIGTFIDQSGIRAAFEGVFNSIVSTIQDVFSGGGIDAEAAAIQAEGQVFQRAQNPITAVIQQLIGGITKGIELFTPEIEESFNQIVTGITGFINNLSTADTSGFDNIIANMLQMAGALGGLIATITLFGVDIVSDIFENVLPSLGTAISGIITAISGIGEGDPKLLIEGISTALSGLLDAFLGITASVADPLLEVIEKIAGIELPDTQAVFDGISTGIGAIPDILAGIATRIAEALNDVAVSIRTGVRDLKQEVLEAGVQVGAVGAAVGLDAGLVQDTSLQSQAISIAEQLERDLNASVDAGGPIQIDLPQIQYITQDLGPGTQAFDAVVSNIADPLLIQEAINTAVQQGDIATVEALLPIATALDLDVETVRTEGVELGVAVNEGIVEGLADPEGTVAAASETVADSVMTPMETALETGSPSQWAARLGQNVVIGFINGLVFTSPLLFATSTLVTTTSLMLPITTLLEDDGSQSLWAYRMGTHVGDGIANGLLARQGVVTSRITFVINEFKRMELSIDTMMNNVARIITTQLDRMTKAFDQFKTDLGDVANIANSVNATGSFAEIQTNWRGGVHRAGLGWVGERGPELISTNRDLAVLNNRTSMAFAAGFEYASRRFGGNRLTGGDVQDDRFYRTNEDGLPELLEDRLGRLFLLPGTDGQIIPASQMGMQTTIINYHNTVIVQYEGTQITPTDLENVREAAALGMSDAERNKPSVTRRLSAGGVR